MAYHIPILLEASINGLNIKDGGTYVDATFGGGGHTKAILGKISSGKVLGIDQDDEAEIQAEMIKNEAFTFIPGNFRHLKRYLKMMQINGVEGILADLGVSSRQIDENGRGFSTRLEGPLDMRMSTNGKLTAEKVLNTYSEKDLTRVFFRFGEIKNAKSLASAIVSARINKRLKTTGDLVTVAKKFAPSGKEFKYYARVFQAVRIEVNDELGALAEFLNQCSSILNKYGRLAVISYHSLEDRMVKNLINYGNIEGKAEKDLYGNFERPFQPVNKKPIVPSPEEINNNPRARSAKLRIAERS